MSGSAAGYALVLVETPDRKLKLYGCPSGRSDALEEADEITEVNGRPLDCCLLADITEYVHRCIHSRTLCVRVKPKKSQDPVGDVRIRDTFFISVSRSPEDPPPDMTQLSGSSEPQQTTPHNNNNRHEENGLKSSKTEKESFEVKKFRVSSTIPVIQPPPLPSPLSDALSKTPAGPPIPAPRNVSLKKSSPGTALAQPRHREMAVDVPDTFVAVTKTTPRYPPPPKRKPPTPQTATSSLKKNGLYRFTTEQTTPQHARSRSSQEDGKGEEPRKTPPTPRISEVARKSVDPVDGPPVESEHSDRIRKYQEDFRRRQEEQDRQAREDDFLRSSLRGSKKLRDLAQGGGQDNDAFQAEEEGAPPAELTRTYQCSELLGMLHNVEALLSKTHFNESLVDLEKLLRSQEFKSLLALHNKIEESCCFKCLPSPTCADAQVVSLDVMRELQESPSKESQELLDILGKPEFENFMFCHDKVAATQLTPDLSEEEELLSRVSQYTEKSIKIVRIDKTTEPLGATVKNDGESVIVGRIVKGGVAEKSGLLHEGDEILEVNGLEMRGKSVNDVCDIMASMSGTLTFLIVPSQYDSPKPVKRESVMHLKAHFDYEPDDDLYMPCRELGMAFQKGDVLHIIGQDDPNWWQAFREGEQDQLLAGLVPSKSFQQQREVVKQAVIGDTRERKSKKGKFLCARRHNRRKKKKMYNLNYSDDTDSEQILTYEEVRLYYPRAHQKRPLVLIGPQKVGRHELRQRLMEDTERFAAAVPHTSRTKKDSELNGVDYFFISRTQFEADILAGRFVEHGEYQKSYYGTSLDAIRSVIDAGKTCVLNLHPQSLKILKKSDLMPFVVFIAPPSLEKLRQNCLRSDAAVKDDELKDIIERARDMEEAFGHYFDLALTNLDLDKTLGELLRHVSLIEREPQWVPAAWIAERPPA